jgi:hypothetical protein
MRRIWAKMTSAILEARSSNWTALYLRYATRRSGKVSAHGVAVTRENHETSHDFRGIGRLGRTRVESGRATV